ncbi:MAG: leucyl/phenylalanyl-tRNA--protein transferase [Planctomycetota bacterium]|jgi:leucyl/phenylalanyl-tRNA--protein transferase
MVNTHDSATPRPLSLTPDLLIAAYSQGMFPMARSRQTPGVDWYSPDPRAILPLDGFHCPRQLQRIIQQDKFEIRFDTAFREVVEACGLPRMKQLETWINREIVDAYTQMHRMGLAHSVEAWLDDRLVGGLYGVSLGGAFFGESMFHRTEEGGRDASKVCLAKLVDTLNERGFDLLDVQINSEHMARFGTIDISRDRYLLLLERALRSGASW